MVIFIMHLLNIMLIALVEPVNARYTFYTDVLVFIVLVITLSNYLSGEKPISAK